MRLLPVQLRYAYPSELDLMARLAGLALRDRFDDWKRAPFTGSTGTCVSVYGGAGERSARLGRDRAQTLSPSSATCSRAAGQSAEVHPPLARRSGSLQDDRDPVSRHTIGGSKSQDRPSSPSPRHPAPPIPRGCPAVAGLVARAQVATPVVRVIQVESGPRFDELTAAGAANHAGSDERSKTTPCRLMRRPVPTLRSRKTRRFNEGRPEFSRGPPSPRKCRHVLQEGYF
jgi:hypothetical protein